MSLHIFRVKVRGRFADLDPEVADALRAAADDALPAFTEDGTFAYGPALTFFTFRYQLRAAADDPEEAAAAVREEAERRARAHLDGRGIAGRDVSVSAFDMADVWA